MSMCLMAVGAINDPVSAMCPLFPQRYATTTTFRVICTPCYSVFRIGLAANKSYLIVVLGRIVD